MSEINKRLEYIDTTKSLIKDAINEIGGTLTDESTFDEYPEQVKNLIGTSIIPQSDLDKFVEKTRSISGFKQLYGTWDQRLYLNGLVNSAQRFIHPNYPEVEVEIRTNLYNFRSGGTGYNSISGDLPIHLNKGSSGAPYNSLGHRQIVTVYNNSNTKKKVNFKLSLMDSKGQTKLIYSTFKDKYTHNGYGPVTVQKKSSTESYYLITPPPRALTDEFEIIDNEYYFTQKTLDKYNSEILNLCDRYELEFTVEEA